MKISFNGLRVENLLCVYDDDVDGDIDDLSDKVKLLGENGYELSDYDCDTYS